MEQLSFDKLKKDKSISELLDFSILIVDKPAGWTSFDVVSFIREKLNLKKAGHLGTLDSNVTGVLPIVLNNACKIQEYFMHRDKVYIGKMKLHKEISKEKLEKAMKEFLGKINQIPPRKSRVKRQVRERQVMKFELIDYDVVKREARFLSEVEAGTYIRKLCSDLGEKLGFGVQMIELLRTKAGLFSDKDNEFCTIGELEEAVKDFKENKKEEKLRKLIIPAEIIIKLMPNVVIYERYAKKLLHGSPIFEEMLIDKQKSMKIIDSGSPFLIFCNNELIEVAKKNKEKSLGTNILAWPEVVIKSREQ
jgi:H/ACA ribonucleoprotein complex subunit 4